MPASEARPPFEPLEATVRGLLRGRELSGRWRAALVGPALTLAPSDAPARAPLTLPVAELEGARLGHDELTVFVARGDVLELRESERLAELAARLDALALEVGEVMRASRAAGSRRAAPGTLHDRFFEPFLAARLRVAAGSEAGARLDAADAHALREALARVLDGFSEERFPEEPADRRALDAELEEYAAPLFRSLDRLEAAAAEARAAAPERRYVAWRGWTAALAECYTQAERTWLAAVPALTGSMEAEAPLAAGARPRRRPA